MDKVLIFADGGCRGNQFESNIGGWGVLLSYRGKTKELYGATQDTTNNIMELTSCIEGLKAIKDHSKPVQVVMDSQYVIMGVNNWSYGWARNGWMNSQKKPVENKALWIELLDLKKQFKEIEFIKCKGHSVNEGNNRADALVNKAMDEYISKKT